ncbi:relaxase MobL [Metaclostridioides mangenotii]|uniref:Succinate dehydrogenase flavin-adding protein (Antitoxin of CptAB toxin-antitoxin module) n=1 Tax=Metaclostridioides mangenotii TaxID=1540 RepID=A0ABS4EEM2_9FIRM|nr:relaxase MobL [Clostridioides mangenotii]MBP1856395.1 succinate dehydrogenase flavin-adding protein (antitoxin of CptAB toxin-antitoxin module) [Clostridioides mangenotii]
MYKKAIENLPKDKKQWAYEYNTMKESRVYLDKITEHYLKNYKKEEYEELIKLLDEQQENLLYTYGEGKHNYYKNYKENKIKDLYKRMGNLQ